MPIDTTLALLAQQYQLDMSMAMLRAQHQAQQGLVNMLTESLQAPAAVNPAHLGQQVDTRA